jgi:hypothetical protein
MATKEEAKAAVLDIAKRYGYIDDLTADLDPVRRAEIEDRFLALETVAAASIKT